MQFRSTANFRGMYCYFPVIRLVNFVYVAPVIAGAPNEDIVENHLT